jgi:dipeptidyl aminopeptidase/acylaminoacyl peptidase
VLRHLRKWAPATLTLAALLVLVSPMPGDDQAVSLGKEAYLMPPKEIADAVLAPQHETRTLTNLSPDGMKFVISKSDGLPPLERLARPCVYLAEMAFDPVACRSRELWIRSSVGFDIFYHADKRTVAVQVPERARVSNPVWSPDSSMLAFLVHFDEATHVYVADTETGYSRRLTITPVLATLVTTFQWSGDGRRIQTVLLPDDGKREMPRANGVPAQPKVRVARGGTNPSRTYRFLLESPQDMKLLEHLATGQLALIDVNDGKVTRIGFPNMIRSVSMAPGERDFRVTTIKKPFSYFVPFTRFGSQEGIWNLEGKSLSTLADRKLQETEPQPATPPAQVAGQPAGTGKKGKFAKNPAPAPGPQPDQDPAARLGPHTDPDGKRNLSWRPDGTLSFLQLEPPTPKDKDAKDAKEPRKDRVMQWLPPYGKNDVKVVQETPQAITGFHYSDDCRLLFLTQTVSSQRQISAVDLADAKKAVYALHKSPAGGATATLAANPNPNDDDAPLPDDGDEQQPGPGRGFRAGLGAGAAPSLMTRSTRGAVPVVRISASGDVFVTGADRDKTSAFPRPFIDKIGIKSGKKTRVFEGKGDMFETIDAVDGDDVKLVFTTRQNKDAVPDSYVTDVQSKKLTKLTANVNHTPWFNQLKVERIQVTRVDGFKFWVKVTTPAPPTSIKAPPPPKQTGKLPALFWIYPKEYASQAAYDNAAARDPAAGAGRFAAPGPRSMTLLALLGYAVVEPDIPIVGPPGRINDNYVPDLRNSLWAVIDDLDRRGIIDRDRLAVGGHSYGAFSTANALAHTPFFKAGIAGDGNYNRTLTTMSFQAERRHLWDARETYLEMSPLLWANRVHGALLMYHGMDDANVGTNPINAQHMFLALDGLGKPAALYMYPYEGHGPIARETTLDLWARWVAWLDTYVKNPKKKETPSPLDKEVKSP